MLVDHGQVERDTIAAIATAPGRGALGVVRVSGGDARGLVEPLLRLRRPLTARHAQFTQVLLPDGQELVAVDDAVVTWFAAPQSYTAEEVVEISVHGSPVVLQAILAELVRRGARLAEPGEFTRRAVLNGRLDLIRAEAVNDLIGAVTLHGARVAAAQLGGALARTLQPLKDALLQRIAEAEAGIEFAEADGSLGEDFSGGGKPGDAGLRQIRDRLLKLCATYGYGRMVREGASLAIVGRPNTGKSSLFNGLLRRERAIVTAEAGTTRDPVVEHFQLGGLPIELIDTAGLRDEGNLADGAAELMGMARSREALAEADLVLLVVDAVEAVSPNSAEVRLTRLERGLLRQAEGRLVVRVLSRCDLLPAQMRSSLWSGWIRTSAQTGEGLGELREKLIAELTGGAPGLEQGVVANLRQYAALSDAVGRLDAALRAVAASMPDDLWIVDLYATLEALDSLTGATSTEAILDRIFAGFCVGK